MYKFRTTFDIPQSEVRISYENPIFSIGSCFAEHIANRLNRNLFNVVSNPNGVVFNPVSIAFNLIDLLNKKEYQISDLAEYKGIWNSWDHHHILSGNQPEKVISEMNRTANLARGHLKKTKFIIVSFGSAFAYQYNDSGKIVANCHKIPNTEFTKIRLSQYKIVGMWQDVLDKLLAQNPDITVIITVSPVRHIKDGIIENQKSKSILLLSADALSAQYESVHYFPAYEIVMDDLRDYRFYEPDLIHPNQVAIEYIWSRFKEIYFDPGPLQIMSQIEALSKSKAHRPIHPKSIEALNFQQGLNQKWLDLFEKYPFLQKPGKS